MAKIKIDRILCKKCGICAFVCPKQVFKFNELEGPQVDHPDDCIFCERCIMMCPDMAIDIRNEIKEGKPNK